MSDFVKLIAFYAKHLKSNHKKTTMMPHTYSSLSQHLGQDNEEELLSPLALLSDIDAKVLIEALIKEIPGHENQCRGILSYLRPNLHRLIEHWTGGNYSDIRDGQENNTLDDETQQEISNFLMEWHLLPLPDRDFIHYSKDDHWDSLEVGQELHLKSFMGCAPHGRKHTGNGPARLRFQPSLQARFLGAFTMEQNEREVLIRPNAKFVVERFSGGLFYLHDA